VIAVERAGEFVDQKLSATDRLARVQSIIDEELGWAVSERAQARIRPRTLQEVILKFTGEVRQQLGLQLAISPTLVDLKVVWSFGPLA
jgi:hypothetical protein